MGTIFRIVALCQFLGHLGGVTSDSCGSTSLKAVVTLVADLEGLAELLATKQESEGDDSPQFYYSKDTISCSKVNDDCSEQRCCAGKTPKCNVETKKCDCVDSATNKFTGRPLIYLQNSGQCGENGASCTICVDKEVTKKLFDLDQGQRQRLEGNGSALALSNQTSLSENVKILGDLSVGGIVGGLVGTVIGLTASLGVSGVLGTAITLVNEITGVDLCSL